MFVSCLTGNRILKMQSQHHVMPPEHGPKIIFKFLAFFTSTFSCMGNIHCCSLRIKIVDQTFSRTIIQCPLSIKAASCV